MTESLEDKIERLRASTEEFTFEIEKKRKTSTYGRISKDVTSFQKFSIQIISAFIWIFRKIIYPFLFWAIDPCKWIIGQYIKLWNRLVYIKDEYDIPIFSQVRAGVTVLATFVFFYFLFLPSCGLIADTGLYVATAQVNENVYLNGSQELDNLNGMHAVEGCTKLPCSDADAIYFRTSTSWFNDVWSVLHRGHLFYPDQVASGVPYDISKCVITSYGIRNRWLNHNGLSYPNLLAYVCIPIADGRKNVTD